MPVSRVATTVEKPGRDGLDQVDVLNITRGGMARHLSLLTWHTRRSTASTTSLVLLPRKRGRVATYRLRAILQNKRAVPSGAWKSGWHWSLFQIDKTLATYDSLFSWLGFWTRKEKETLLGQFTIFGWSMWLDRWCSVTGDFLICRVVCSL